MGVSEDTEINPDEVYQHIMRAYTNYEISQEPVIQLSTYHPIAVYDPMATSRNQKWIDRDTLEEINPDYLVTYDTFLMDYDNHPEHKFSHGDTGDKGFTIRRHIRASAIKVMGKEYKGKDEAIITEGEIKHGVRYDDSISSETITPDFMESLKSVSAKEIAYVTNLSTSTIKRLKKDPSRVSQKVIEKVSDELIIQAEEETDRQKTVQTVQQIVQREGLRKISSEIGITPSSLSRILSGKQALTPEKADLLQTYVQSYKK
jgi:transcriptional regulator with XRE-family HTH domain